MKSTRSERRGLLEVLLVRLLGRVRSGLLGSGGGSSDNSGFALLGCRLGDNLVERRLEDLDGVGERLAGAKLTLGVPALHTVEKASSTI